MSIEYELVFHKVKQISSHFLNQMKCLLSTLMAV
uniref:Uncharacterized protein n=1 Tax=Anguilla anguilla TaxID=7936 RepID=A0A0E9RSR0_ANGAN